MPSIECFDGNELMYLSSAGASWIHNVQVVKQETAMLQDVAMISKSQSLFPDFFS